MKIAFEQEDILYRQLRKGNANAQQYFYAQNYNLIATTCLRYVNNPLDAEELCADSFIQFFTTVKDKFEYRGVGSMSAFIKTIAVNKALMFLRKKSINFEAIETTPMEHILATKPLAIDNIQAKHIMNCVQQLPVGYRTVLNLFVMEQYTHQQIAEALQISVSTSKSQLMKAKASLKKILEAYER